MKIEVLDHGYVQFIEAWGVGTSGRDVADYRDDSDYEIGIIEAARQSTQGNFRGWEQDAKLLAYLYNNQHSTPFEFAGMVIEVQAPLFVFREWHRHRTQSYNEMSARYSPLPDLNYVPTIERLLVKNQANKQAGAIKGAAELDEVGAKAFQRKLKAVYVEDERHYQDALADGVPKELARVLLPVGRYSKMRASANLRNWLAFMTLRCAPGAQYEIQVYADAVAKIVSESFPQTYALWYDQIDNLTEG
jgi:thymidylate synthase (FAD)